LASVSSHISKTLEALIETKFNHRVE
jgi:hypothetical protein